MKQHFNPSSTGLGYILLSRVWAPVSKDMLQSKLISYNITVPWSHEQCIPCIFDVGNALSGCLCTSEGVGATRDLDMSDVCNQWWVYVTATHQQQ